jgi:hypothetical protein
MQSEFTGSPILIMTCLQAFDYQCYGSASYEVQSNLYIAQFPVNPPV